MESDVGGLRFIFDHVGDSLSAEFWHQMVVVLNLSRIPPFVCRLCFKPFLASDGGLPFIFDHGGTVCLDLSPFICDVGHGLSVNRYIEFQALLVFFIGTAPNKVLSVEDCKI